MVCEYKHKCHYTYFFLNIHCNNTNTRIKHNTNPNPFVIEPPLNGKKSYREGDLLEFDLLLVGENLEGKLFVQFVALIYVSYIHQCMKKHHLYRNYSMQSLLDEFDVIERFDYEGQRWHCGGITKKQQGLYDCFEVTPPNML